MADENNSLGRRLRRYAKVGVSIGSVATRMAGEKVFGRAVDQEALANDLKVALGGLKGPLMKVAQIMSTVPDMLPEEYVRNLMELQTNAPSMGWPFVKRRMVTELGSNWRGQFLKFERVACNAASLGQVHRATLHDGTPVACKLQYPDMASAVEADLKQLKLAFAVYKQYDKAIDPSEIHKELSARLREELDYELEARHQKLYADIMAAESSVSVATVIESHSTNRLLTMTWLDGQPLLSVRNKPVGIRNMVAKNMFKAWYVPFYFYGVLHGDPHLGNYSVRDDGSVNLLDFGCVRFFRPEFVGGVLDLYHALKNGDEELAVLSYKTWGFESPSKELIEVLNHWARFVYGPVMEDRTRRIEETNAAVYGAQVAAKVHAELRKIGGVTPPREFVLMDRAAIGLGSVFMHLDAEINWYRLFQETVGNFKVAELENRQAAALKKAGIKRPD